MSEYNINGEYYRRAPEPEDQERLRATFQVYSSLKFAAGGQLATAFAELKNLHDFVGAVLAAEHLDETYLQHLLMGASLTLKQSSSDVTADLRKTVDMLRRLQHAKYALRDLQERIHDKVNEVAQ